MVDPRSISTGSNNNDTTHCSILKLATSRGAYTWFWKWWYEIMDECFRVFSQCHWEAIFHFYGNLFLTLWIKVYIYKLFFIYFFFHGSESTQISSIKKNVFISDYHVIFEVYIQQRLSLNNTVEC